MHDFDVVSRIASLIGTTRGRYEGLTLDVTSQILADIQSSIRQKDEEMSYMDACCLQLALKGRNSKDKPETYTFQTRDPNAKREWIVGKSVFLESFEIFLRAAELCICFKTSPTV